MRLFRKLFESAKIRRFAGEQHGFALIVIPVLFLLFGFFFTAVLSESKPADYYFESVTQDNMEDVRKALAAYAHRNYRIPCPADPAAAPADLGVETPVGGSNNECLTTVGILPFRALGLTEDAATDEWGHFFTYKVSPGFTRVFQASDFVAIGDAGEELLVADDDSENFVHQICRSPEWTDVGVTGYYKPDGQESGSFAARTVNRNIYKARFCCSANVEDGSSFEFTAKEGEPAANAPGQQEELPLLKPDETVAKLTLGQEALDENIVVYDSGSVQGWVDFSKQWIQRSNDMIYNEALDGGADGLGPRWDFVQNGNEEDECPDQACSAGNNGKFFAAAAILDFNLEETSATAVQLGLSDVGPNNYYNPVQIAMDIVDENGELVDTVEYVLVLPETPTGLAEIEISLSDILGDATQEGLFHPGVDLNSEEGPNGHGDDAVALFEESQEDFLDVLEDLGREPDDISGFRIGRLKLNAFPASLAFNRIAYTDPGSISNTDLVVFNEAGDERIPRRDNEDSYGSPNSLYDGEVNQDFEGPAYVLISHGKDGEGAFIVNGTNARFDNIDDSLENPFEVTNHSDAREVYDVRKITSTAQAEKFDDIIKWDSQMTLYNSLRSGTCETAQADSASVIIGAGP